MRTNKNTEGRAWSAARQAWKALSPEDRQTIRNHVAGMPPLSASQRATIAAAAAPVRGVAA